METVSKQKKEKLSWDRERWKSHDLILGWLFLEFNVTPKLINVSKLYLKASIVYTWKSHDLILGWLFLKFNATLMTHKCIRIVLKSLYYIYLGCIKSIMLMIIRKIRSLLTFSIIETTENKITYRIETVFRSIMYSMRHIILKERTLLISMMFYLTTSYCQHCLSHNLQLYWIIY